MTEEKLQGDWFKGNVFSMPYKEFLESQKFDKDVKKPTALRTKKIDGIEYSQFYYKPIEQGEFTD